MDLLPEVVGYGVGTGGSGARGLGQRVRDLFLTEGEVICEFGEVNVCLGGGRGSWKEVVREGRVNTLRGVLIGEGGEARLLTLAGKFLGFPHRGRGKGRKVSGPVGELGFFDGREVGSACRAHGGVVIRVSGGLEGSGGGMESLTKGGEEGGPPGFGPGGGPGDRSVGGDEGLDPDGVSVEPLLEEGRGARGRERRAN